MLLLASESSSRGVFPVSSLISARSAFLVGLLTLTSATAFMAFSVFLSGVIPHLIHVLYNRKGSRVKDYFRFRLD